MSIVGWSDVDPEMDTITWYRHFFGRHARICDAPSDSFTMIKRSRILSFSLKSSITMLASRLAARTVRVAAPRVSLAATRGYAEQAKSASNTKPPVPLFGLDGTYASALVCFKHIQLQLRWYDLVTDSTHSTPRLRNKARSTRSPKPLRT